MKGGGPAGLTGYYWLTDDAISSSSWSYTEGIGYYSKKQVMHGFIDRISKNGNLLLNISPMPDGTIPREQKDLLLSIGSWLKKYGEAVYSTRAWEKYGEGPTPMGAAHGVMGAPKEGTAQDIRFTRSKDSATLYAILMGWEKDQKDVKLTSLSSDRINLENLQSVELIAGEAGKYLPLTYKIEKTGMVIDLPVKSFEEPAYVIKLSFKGKIPDLDQYADIHSAAHYYLVPGNNSGNLMLGPGMMISGERKNTANQWKLEPKGKGVYIIRNRENYSKVLAYSGTDESNIVPSVETYSGNDNQKWKIEHSYLGLYKISNIQFPLFLSLETPTVENSKAEMTSLGMNTPFGWNLMEVCELTKEPYKLHNIPGTIEAEDFDKGCQEDAYFDSDEFNEGGAYRPNEPVDIEKSPLGLFNIGWTKKGEWLVYSVNIKKSALYNVLYYTATNLDNVDFHMEIDGLDITGNIPVPNTFGYQNWKTIAKTMKLSSGKHEIKIVIDNPGLNLDKIVFEEAD